MAKLKVLFATSEVAPLIKTGGLADVSAALPAALRALGNDVRVLVPGYPQVLARLLRYKIAAKIAPMPGFPSARLYSTTLANGVPVLVLDCPILYQRNGGPYQDVHGRDWNDNDLRFGLLSKVAALLGSSASPLGWRPDLVHCNDWQTGLAPAYLRFAHSAAPSVMTIHNLAFQGIFPPTAVTHLELPPSSFDINGVEYYGNLSFLKAGLFYADHITTVSPNYAEEIQHEEFGFGLQGLLKGRHNELTGILNGIDTAEWNPAADPHLLKQYGGTRMAGKAADKEALQRNLGLTVAPELPLLGVISRFTHQKGLDVLLDIAPRLAELPVQLALLGSGEAALEKIAQGLVDQHPGRIAVHTGFDEALAHQIEAGADLFIMPSRFEPCGLNQMYSQRYGTPPIVHAIGGLMDSVVDCTDATLRDGSASGFAFSGLTDENLFAAIQRALGFYRQPRKWNRLRRICMAGKLGWEESAAAYQTVYRKVLQSQAQTG